MDDCYLFSKESTFMSQDGRLQILLSILLIVVTFVVFSQMLSHSFLIIDDHLYVTQNEKVKKGLTLHGLLWAFSTIHAEFWHPLTWLSLMLDTQLFGVNPSGYLLTNLMLHLGITLMLFFLLNHTTHHVWKSGFVAALFAIHPLHVESVVWISARKDVLCAFFWMLTMWSYIAFLERKGSIRYIAVHFFFILGLMAKPMIITLPVLLLLLDIWPLKRLSQNDPLPIVMKQLLYLVKEKMYLFAISVLAGISTIITHYKGGGLATMEIYSLGERLANALTSYVAYIVRMVWPRNLAVFYPFPLHFPVWEIIVSIAVIVSITVIAISLHKQYPFVIVGWLWYVVSLLPVIGLIKIGDFANADRYTYLPLIGLSIIIAWGLPVCLSAWPYKQFVSAVSSSIILIILAMMTWTQVTYWSNSKTLFEHALQATGSNFYVHHSLGNIYASQKQFNHAIDHFKRAVQLNLKKQTLKNNLARALMQQGRFSEAKYYLSVAITENPEYPNPHYTLGLVLTAQGDLPGALAHFTKAIHLSKYFSDHPHFLPALVDLVGIYAERGEYDKALLLYKIDTSMDWLKKAGAKGFERWEIFQQKAQ